MRNIVSGFYPLTTPLAPVSCLGATVPIPFDVTTWCLKKRLTKQPSRLFRTGVTYITGSSVTNGSLSLFRVVKKLVVNSSELLGRNGKNIMFALTNMTRKTKLSVGVAFTVT